MDVRTPFFQNIACVLIGFLFLNPIVSTADELALVVAPEGSRTGDGTWRTGVWHIARAAGVPIVPAWVNHETMLGGIGPPIWPSDDLAADLAKFAAFYRSKRPDSPRFEKLAEQAEGMARNG